MATLATPSSSSPSPSRMGSRKWARKCERYCCIGVTYFPLAFVYGLTSWAVWVEASMGFGPTKSAWIGTGSSLVGISLYILLNWSYTTAVFTEPGSTIQSNDGYNSLPTHAPPAATSFTVKSTGEVRFCKKCQARKPDRAHHCSTCRRCVLKMDHHCPWLATCVGLRNYKAFLLFLIYTTIFCGFCFIVSGSWVWNEVLNDANYDETFMPINFVMLAVLSGIIGVVLCAFTGWHILLACRGQTTIECLEKTRYLSPLRKAMQHQHIVQHQGNDPQGFVQQLRDIHANALPGVTRPEEGEIHVGSDRPRETRVHHSYDALERFRARERYEEYLDEQDSEKLPNAFDLGWRKNLAHLLGPNRWLWFLPICNTTGDGWSWEASPKWVQARDKARIERESQQERERNAGWGHEPNMNNAHMSFPREEGAGRHYLTSPANQAGRISPSKADRILGRDPAQYMDIPGERRPSSVSLRTLKPRDDIDEDDYDTSSDEQEAQSFTKHTASAWTTHNTAGTTRGLLGKGQVAKNSLWPSNDQHASDDVD